MRAREPAPGSRNQKMVPPATLRPRAGTSFDAIARFRKLRRPFWSATFSFLACSRPPFSDFLSHDFFNDFREVPGLHFGCFLMTFGWPFWILFHVFSWILKNVKYVSRLMYFVVLRLQKVIKNRYFLVMNFMFFRGPNFYWFLIDFGRPWGLQKSSLSVPVAFSKKKVLIQRLHLMRKGSKNLWRDPAGSLGCAWLVATMTRGSNFMDFGRILNRFGTDFSWFSHDF